MTDFTVSVTRTEIVFDGHPTSTLILTEDPAVSLELGQFPVSLTVETPSYTLIAAAEQGPSGPLGPLGPQGPQGPVGPQATADLDPDFILDGGNF